MACIKSRSLHLHLLLANNTHLRVRTPSFLYSMAHMAELHNCQLR